MFKNREQAGLELAERLGFLKGSRYRVLALPRGGVAVARVIANLLDLPLDVCIAKKITAPNDAEYAIGAIAEDGSMELNRRSIRFHQISADEIENGARIAGRKIQEQVALYRMGRLPLKLEGQRVILVDDGMATGATMLAAIKYLRHERVTQVLVAVPTSSADAAELVSHQADGFFSVVISGEFSAVGDWYEEFPQLADEDVIHILREGDRRQKKSA